MSLSLALFTDRQARLFRWLFGQPQRSYHLNELLRLTQLSSASIQQELKRLCESGLVNSSRLGNLRLFQANASSPLFPELVSLTRKTADIDRLLELALEPLKSKLTRAFIYGSVAKQTDSSASDIDLMLIGKSLTLSKIFHCLQALEESLRRKINPTCLTPQEFELRCQDPDSFLSKVLSQPVIELFTSSHGN